LILSLILRVFSIHLPYMPIEMLGLCLDHLYNVLKLCLFAIMSIVSRNMDTSRINLLLILKCFFTSSSEVLWTSMLRYLKYLVRLVYSIDVRLRTLVTAFWSMSLVHKPMAKLHKNMWSKTSTNSPSLNWS